MPITKDKVIIIFSIFRKGLTCLEIFTLFFDSLDLIENKGLR
jgi:hypothetical protein